MRDWKQVQRWLIVRVLDYDVEDDTPFLVMDYAVGGTLRNRHPRGTRLPFTTILSYVTQVADALQYAHDQRVIHRDIKPENMLVGEHDELLLSDFGIAIVAQSSRYQSTQQMGGTMAYIAPEQIQGHPRPAPDQYSLGIVVYEWLSGNCPFHGSMTEIVAQHLAASPPSLREQVPTISPHLEQVVLTALEKDPYKRFKSIKAFVSALEQACQKVQASPEISIVPLQSSASVIEPGEQTLQAERPFAERASPPGRPVLQTPRQLLPPVPSPPETPSGPSAIQSFPSLPPIIPAQDLPLSDESRTEWRTRREAPENLGKVMPAPGSSRPRSMLITGISIVLASALLVAALLGKWIVTPERAPTPTPTLTASVIPGSTPMPTPTPTPVPAGIITEFAVPTAQSQPNGITAGPDGNFWFPEGTGNKIGRISPSGTITEFPIPTANSIPIGITVGPDGNLWFSELKGNKIGRIRLNGTITEFAVPTAQSGPVGFTVGPDGHLWFSELAGKIGRINPSGIITEFPIPTADHDLGGFAVGRNGNLWFTESNNNKIGYITSGR